MNQFVFDMAASQPGLRSSHPVIGDTRLSASARGGSLRSAWPFLVNSSAVTDKRAPKDDAYSPPGFAS